MSNSLHFSVVGCTNVSNCIYTECVMYYFSPQCVSELRFDGFSLHQISESGLLEAPHMTTDHKLQPEVSSDS